MHLSLLMHLTLSRGRQLLPTQVQVRHRFLQSSELCFATTLIEPKHPHRLDYRWTRLVAGQRVALLVKLPTTAEQSAYGSSFLRDGTSRLGPVEHDAVRELNLHKIIQTTELLRKVVSVVVESEPKLVAIAEHGYHAHIATGLLPSGLSS
ncbi:hypothetical protein AB1Y20_021374 [Prymnesium parvum]|uniref:Uncharacterized protein n=1 Tax=Prymnesium parvum TaxID=97485 RepID=A0AB34JJK1_PRYPA